MYKKIQQGDVVLKSVISIPEGVKKMVKKNQSGHVLAEGEVTGHAHIMDDTTTELYEKDGKLFISVSKTTDLKHLKGNTGLQADHNPVTVPTGDYEVRIVQEFDPFAEEVRKVQD
jgi:hypothetical protein